MAIRFSDGVKKAAGLARFAALENYAEKVFPNHLVMGIFRLGVENPSLNQVFEKIGVNTDTLSSLLSELNRGVDTGVNKVPWKDLTYDKAARGILERAMALKSINPTAASVAPIDILRCAAFRSDDEATAAILKDNIDFDLLDKEYAAYTKFKQPAGKSESILYRYGTWLDKPRDTGGVEGITDTVVSEWMKRGARIPVIVTSVEETAYQAAGAVGAKVAGIANLWEMTGKPLLFRWAEAVKDISPGELHEQLLAEVRADSNLVLVLWNILPEYCRDRRTFSFGRVFETVSAVRRRVLTVVIVAEKYRGLVRETPKAVLLAPTGTAPPFMTRTQRVVRRRRY